MDVRSADAAVGDLDVDVCLGEGFGFVFLPDHVALDTFFVEAKPALEFVVGRHDGLWYPFVSDGRCSLVSVYEKGSCF